MNAHNNAFAKTRVNYKLLRYQYGPLLLLLLGVSCLGLAGLSAARLLFVAGSFIVGVLAYRRGGLSLHVQIAIALFVFSPFVRRVIDMRVGYDVGATILVSPLLAVTAAFPELRGLLSTRLRNFNVLLPFLLITVCLVYGWLVSTVEGNLLQPTIAAVKYFVPMFYAICLALRSDESDKILLSASRALLVLCPIMAVYGIVQYIAPPKWDIFWIIYSQSTAVGLPEARRFRIFSLMNFPSSFAVYAVSGFLFFSFAKSLPRMLMVSAILPLSVALLLTGVRTGWISITLSLLFCLLFKESRARAGLVIANLSVGVLLTLFATPFGAAIMGRLSTLGSGVSQDASGSERMHDYLYVFTEGDKYIFGVGLNGQPDPRMIAFDGQLLMSVAQMGIVIGTIHVALIMWAGGQALLGVVRRRDPVRIAAASFLVGQMAVFLLLGFAFGEVGFLFWTIVGVLTPSVTQTRHSGAMPPRPAYLAAR